MRNLVVSAAFIGMGCVAKPVYFPLMFLLIPCIWERVKPLLNSKRNRHICALILGISILLIAGVATIKMKPLLYNMAEGNLNYLGDPRGGDTGVSGQLLNIAEHPLAFGKMLIQEIFSFDNFRNAGDEVENTTLVCNQMFLNLYILGTLKEVWALILLPLLLLIFLVLGSTCIYPRDAEQPMKEEVLLTSPLEYTNEPYAIAKIAGLKMCESFNLQYGTNYIAVMPTNLYGPNDNFDLERSHVLPAMIRKIHLAHCLKQGDWDAIRKDLDLRPVEGIGGTGSKEDILTILAKYGISDNEVKLWGTGTPLREFLWSEEMADASVFVMEHVDFKDTYKPDDKDIRNCHINIGTGKEISIRNLAELIVSTVGYKGQLSFDSSKPDGTMRKLTDPSKLHSLGWHHKVEIEEGVQRIYHWYLKS